jgi:Tfp pilus assembly protein PilN
MTTQTTVVGTPTLPRVNLLPPEIAEARTLKQYRLGAGGAVVLTAVAVGVFYYQSHGGVASAQSALDASNAKTAQLRTQLASYQGVTQVKNEVQSAQATLAAALAPQILWSKYLQDMSVSLVGNYWLSGLTMAATSSAATGSTTGSSPLTDGSAVGSIVLTGSAISHYDVADLLRSLAKQQGLSSKPVVSSSTKDASGAGLPSLVRFTVTQTVDSTGRPSATATPTTAPAASGGVAAGSDTNTTPTKAASN